MVMVNVNLRALTPIWTGNINRKCKEIKETGIIGSMRWWYEAMIRGMGRYGCDPANSACKDDAHCDVCHIFGCTGWGRFFRLEISEIDRKHAPFVIAKPGNKPSFLGYYDPSGKSYQENGGILSSLSISTYARNNIDPDLLISLFNLTLEWGIGARTQAGFGIASTNGSNASFSSELPKSSKAPQKEKYTFELPALNKFFFIKIPLRSEYEKQIKSEIMKDIYKTMDKSQRFSENEWSFDYFPSSPLIRKAIRGIWKDNDLLRHYLMGFVSIKGNPKPIHVNCEKSFSHNCVYDKNNRNKFFCLKCYEGNLNKSQVIEKLSSKIFVSHIYNNLKNQREMKIWGWVPDELNELFGKERKEILYEIKNELFSENFWKKCFNLLDCPIDCENIQWREDISTEELLKKGGHVF